MAVAKLSQVIDTPISTVFEIVCNVFIFKAVGKKTHIDHELVMDPKGLFVIFAPMMGMMAKNNLTKTAADLKSYCEAA
ncbi:hypothetical protein HY024_03145 [Candidatus Curtissbacteria bacterium]|nr:hypothetical protein [Candidatus Curtissbacteria bacterium]